MRIALCTTLLIGALAGTALQSEESSKPQPKEPQIVLIDMARAFKESREFEDRRDDLRAEIAQSDKRAKAMATHLEKLQKQMKASEPESAEYLQYEKEFARKKSDFETFRAVAQRDFMRKEARIYKDIYLKVQAAVRRIAEQRKCALVIRFNSQPLVANDPKKLIEGLQRQVIYHRKQDDITDEAIKAMNDDYKVRVELDR
jgi:outer membrane protein